MAYIPLGPRRAYATEGQAPPGGDAPPADGSGTYWTAAFPADQMHIATGIRWYMWDETTYAQYRFVYKAYGFI
jgi:hypothetical protein